MELKATLPVRCMLQHVTQEAATVCADAMLTRARLGPTPTEEAKEELRKYQQSKYNAEVYGDATVWSDAKEQWLKHQQLQQKPNEEYNADEGGSCSSSQRGGTQRVNLTTQRH